MSHSPSSSSWQNPRVNSALNAIQEEPNSNARVHFEVQRNIANLKNQDSEFLAQDLQKKEELLLDFRRQCRENGVALESAVRTNDQLRDQLDRQRAQVQNRSETIASTAQQSIQREIRFRENAEREGALWKQRFENLASTNKEVEKENLLWQERYNEIREMADRLKQEVGQRGNLERDLEVSLAREQANHDETKRILDRSENRYLAMLEEQKSRWRKEVSEHDRILEKRLEHSEDERLYAFNLRINYKPFTSFEFKSKLIFSSSSERTTDFCS